jgi:hypothetical protein
MNYGMGWCWTGNSILAPRYIDTDECADGFEEETACEVWVMVFMCFGSIGECLFLARVRGRCWC